MIRMGLRVCRLRKYVKPNIFIQLAFNYETSTINFYT